MLTGPSTIIKVHPNGTGALKSSGPQSIGKTCGGWTTKIHMIAIDDKKSLDFSSFLLLSKRLYKN
ncbi:hypothetical protein CCP3SC5AM1_150054 [Gammaproteobacteria bacterium]